MQDHGIPGFWTGIDPEIADSLSWGYNFVFQKRSLGMRSLRVVLAVAILTLPAMAADKTATPEQRAARYLDSVRNQPSLALAFLREMPKGGDLHVHLGGAIWAEDLIDFAADDNLCVDRTTSVLIAPPCDDGCEKFNSKPAIRCAYSDHILYGSIVDAWSMRNWVPGNESGHDHFFATFDKYSLASHTHTGWMIAKAAQQAASDHLQLLELMHTADGSLAIQLGHKVGWDNHLPQMREKLLAAGMKDVVAATVHGLDSDEAKMRERLKCGLPEADPGCGVTVRYIYQVLRGLAPEQVFAQMLLGFELAQADARFVGLNLVMPEDWYVPMHDFELHMRMLDYLHEIYPKVHIDLHAGEVAFGLVSPEGVTYHIRDSVERGHAERIGHGVDVMNEHDPLGLLREMSQRDVLVEICLTSNDLILGVSGDYHPLGTYLEYGVPVALATDDEGVSRIDLTHEYLRAVETYDFMTYPQLKRMARLSLEHSFLPGDSLWSDTKKFRAAGACAGSTPAKTSPGCLKFLDTSERAQLQWKLEGGFAEFEKKY